MITLLCFFLMAFGMIEVAPTQPPVENMCAILWKSDGAGGWIVKECQTLDDCEGTTKDCENDDDTGGGFTSTRCACKNSNGSFFYDSRVKCVGRFDHGGGQHTIICASYNCSPSNCPQPNFSNPPGVWTVACPCTVPPL